MQAASGAATVYTPATPSHACSMHRKAGAGLGAGEGAGDGEAGVVAATPASRTAGAAAASAPESSTANEKETTLAAATGPPPAVTAATLGKATLQANVAGGAACRLPAASAARTANVHAPADRES